MRVDDCFKIGYVSKTHGLKGEVTAIFENEIEVSELTSLFLDFNGNLVPYFIEKISDRGDKSFLKFEGIDSIEQADEIKGRSVFLPKSARPKLKRGQFYEDEVVGFSVSDNALGDIGTVTEVQGAGLNRLLVILHQGKEILVPINSPFVESVNKSKKSIKLSLPEGYLSI